MPMVSDKPTAARVVDNETRPVAQIVSQSGCLGVPDDCGPDMTCGTWFLAWRLAKRHSGGHNPRHIGDPDIARGNTGTTARDVVDIVDFEHSLCDTVRKKPVEIVLRGENTYRPHLGRPGQNMDSA